MSGSHDFDFEQALEHLRTTHAELERLTSSAKAKLERKANERDQAAQRTADQLEAVCNALRGKPPPDLDQLSLQLKESQASLLSALDETQYLEAKLEQEGGEIKQAQDALTRAWQTLHSALNGVLGMLQGYRELLASADKISKG